MSALCRPADREAAAMFEFPVEATVGYPTAPGHGGDHGQANRAPPAAKPVLRIYAIRVFESPRSEYGIIDACSRCSESSCN